MKKFIAASLLSLFTINAFADFSLSCPEIYVRTVNAKERSRDKAHRIVNDMGSAVFFSAFVNPILFFSLAGTSVGLELYAISSSREEKITRLMNEGDKHLIKLTKKLQKKISPEITKEEVLDLVRDGLNSGLYCQNFPHLYSLSDMKEHLEITLKAKYSHQ
jgi:hypothetical protein